MYKNVGSKIKTFAKIFAYIGMIGCWLLGFFVISFYNSGIDNDYIILEGLMIGFFGSLYCWLFQMLLYGIGELIEHARSIDGKLAHSRIKD